jgi:F-type H+-transporting ATPase subunit epsilon
MAGNFKFELVTPERILISEDAEQALVPSLEGEFTALPGHAPVIAALRPGVVEVGLAGARKFRAFVKGGFVEVEGDHVTVLAQRAVDLEAMDPATIASELEAAEAELAAATDDTDKLAAASAVTQLRALQ